jgi:hypothetical protein
MGHLRASRRGAAHAPQHDEPGVSIAQHSTMPGPLSFRPERRDSAAEGKGIQGGRAY